MSLLPACYRRYTSSLDPDLDQYALFTQTPQPAPQLLRMHGWHGQVKSQHTDNVQADIAGDFNHIHPEMRGRGDAHGTPDANGWELQDAVDALAAHASFYPQSVLMDHPPLLWGGSGGGGNVLGLLGKFPDLFAAAVCECGISDYGLWHAHDDVGEFRDELEQAGWIGGDPTGNTEAYLSRGGRTTARNLLTPLVMVHGEVDPRVPFEQATAYVDVARRHSRDGLVQLISFPTVGHPGHYGGITPAQQTQRQTAIADHLAAHHGAPVLPTMGSLVVAGYVRTREFALVLESIDHIARLDYDLAADTFALQAPSSRRATLTRPNGKTTELNCASVDLQDLCQWLAVPC